MPSRKKAVVKKKAGKTAPRKSAKTKKSVAPIRKTAAALSTSAATTRPTAAPSTARPAPAGAGNGQGNAQLAKPMSPGQAAAAQQAEERRKAATRKLFARIRSLEAIVGADLRKRGSLLLSQAVDQWYAEATSTTATDVSITNAARTVISQL